MAEHELGYLDPGIREQRVGAKAVAPLEGLERDLPAPVWARVKDLVIAVDEACSDRDHDEQEREWALLLDHIPGMRLVLEHLQAHVQGGYLDCCDDNCTPAQGLKEEYRR
jgi:hypothetical protein